MRESGDLHTLEKARAAIAGRDWLTAYDAYQAARAGTSLAADDLYAFGDAAWWLGRLDESLAAFEQAYRHFLDASRSREASLCALYIGMTLAIRGEVASAPAWIQRAYRHLEDEPDCVERGYLCFVEFDQALGEEDLSTASTALDRLRELSRRFYDAGLRALSILAEGRLLIRSGEVQPGFALLDEAMLSAITDDIDPSWAGHIYCAMMIVCEEILDLRRAAEWTRATLRWCDGQSSAGPFLGVCQAHRSSILRFQGQWQEAEAAVRGVLTDPLAFDIGSIAEARYQLGELHRLRGDLDAAASEFAEAHLLGRVPQPGMSLLLLSRGDAAGAMMSIETALATAPPGSVQQVHLLAAAVSIAAAAGDASLAERAAHELLALSARYATSGFAAVAHQAEGTVYLLTGSWKPATERLREACRLWADVASPLQAATCRALLGLALQGLGDSPAAKREHQAAETAFAELDLPFPDLLPGPGRRAAALPNRLTEREAEVIALVAAGLTNREIGDALFISPKTVSRHLENIYAKLGLSGRAAATAYAIEHRLVRRKHGSNTP